MDEGLDTRNTDDKRNKRVHSVGGLTRSGGDGTVGVYVIEMRAGGEQRARRRGDYRLVRRSAPRRAKLEKWFAVGVQRLQCLPWEAETGLRWAELLASLRTTGRAMPIKDTKSTAFPCCEISRVCRRPPRPA